MMKPNFLTNDFWQQWTIRKKDQFHAKNGHISGVRFKIKIFHMRLANQNLLQY